MLNRSGLEMDVGGRRTAGVSAVMYSREFYRNLIVPDRVRVSISFDSPPSNHRIEHASLALFMTRSMATKCDFDFVRTAYHRLQIFMLHWEANDIGSSSVGIPKHVESRLDVIHGNHGASKSDHDAAKFVSYSFNHYSYDGDLALHWIFFILIGVVPFSSKGRDEFGG